LFGNAIVKLTGTFRHREPGFIRAVRDARLGNCSEEVEQLIKDFSIEGSAYEEIKTSISHLIRGCQDTYPISGVIVIGDKTP